MDTALVVIDVQEEALEGCPDGAAVVERINELSARAVEAGVPVIFVQHEDDDELVKGTAGWELAAALECPEGSMVVPKTFRDSFEMTELEDVLHRLDTRRLVVTGVHSDFCVQTTALAALVRGYDTTLVSDGHAARPSPESPELSAEAIQMLVNARFATLRYPGLEVGLMPAREINFAGPEVLRTPRR